MIFSHTILKCYLYHDTDVCKQGNEVFLIFIVAREYFCERKIIYVFTTTLTCYVKSSKEIAVVLGPTSIHSARIFCIGFACFEQTETICFILYFNGRLLFSSDVCYIFLVFITAKQLVCGK